MDMLRWGRRDERKNIIGFKRICRVETREREKECWENDSGEDKNTRDLVAYCVPAHWFHPAAKAACCIPWPLSAWAWACACSVPPC